MNDFFTTPYEMSDGLSPQHVWFTSDTHFYHANAIGYCNRPFSSVDEMNEALVNRWNTVVQKGDIVFHLGDFCFGCAKKWNRMLDLLKGRIFLILGNHDVGHLTPQLLARFEGVSTQMLLNISGQRIYLNHFPFLTYSGDTRGVWQLFGHIHSHQLNCNIATTQQMALLQPGQYDVGVDNNDYAPVSFRKVQEIMMKRGQCNVSSGKPIITKALY